MYDHFVTETSIYFFDGSSFIYQIGTTKRSRVHCKCGRILVTLAVVSEVNKLISKCTHRRDTREEL